MFVGLLGVFINEDIDGILYIYRSRKSPPTVCSNDGCVPLPSRHYTCLGLLRPSALLAAMRHGHRHSSKRKCILDVQSFTIPRLRTDKTYPLNFWTIASTSGETLSASVQIGLG